MSDVDPNQALSLIRAACRDVRDAEGSVQAVAAADRLADHAEALDEWLSEGGFLPDAPQPAVVR